MKKLPVFARYLLLAAVMAAVHTWLNGIYLLIAWVLTGLVLALLWQGNRGPFVYILLAEVVTGLFYAVFRWNSYGQLTNMAHNISCPVYLPATVVILLNAVTSVLTIMASYLITRLIRDRRFKKMPLL